MGEGGDSWRAGRRAWERLTEWYRDILSTAPTHRDDGEHAVRALADIGLLRRLLDQAELEAVRTSRRHGKSWAEIATMLGVTRQSAWEKWRDLDDARATQPATRAPQPNLGPPVAAALSDTEAELAGRGSSTSLQPGRGSLVVVPNAIGMSWDSARRLLRRVGLVAVGPDSAAPRLPDMARDGVVTDQSPEADAKVPVGSSVTLWLDSGGGSGTREPRRPYPDPKSGRKMLDEPADEVVVR